MPNFLTYNKWPLRRIIGAVLTAITAFLQGPVFAGLLRSQSPGMLGYFFGLAIWGYILFRLLRAPDEQKTWKGIPHAFFAILLYFLLVAVIGGSSGGYEPMPTPYEIKAQKADECIARRIAAKEDMSIAADECMQEAGMTLEDQRQMMLNTIEMGDDMSVPERVEWCKDFLPYFWEDPSTLDTACVYAANNWKEAKSVLLQGLNDPPYATE